MLSSREELWCLPAQVNISVFPWVANLCWTSQSSNSRQKPFLWGTLAGRMNQSLSSPESNLRLESLWSYGWGLWQEGVSVLPTVFSESGFSFSRHPETFHFISGFLTKGIFSVNCCWIGMFVGGRRVQGFLLCLLLVLLSCFLVGLCLGSLVCPRWVFKKQSNV